MEVKLAETMLERSEINNNNNNNSTKTNNNSERNKDVLLSNLIIAIIDY